MKIEKGRYSCDADEVHQLTGAHLWILRELKRTPGIALEILADRLEIGPPVCASLINELVESGFISFVDRGTWQQEDTCRLTDRGQFALAVLRKKVFLEY